MAKKRKRQGRSRAGASVRLGAEELATRAQGHLQSGRYREAIADLKGLLREGRRPEWLELLAEAYAGRARGLAAKGMLKEALAIWQNRAQCCGETALELDYLELLLRIGPAESVVSLIREHWQALESSGRIDELRARCAVPLLAGAEDLAQAFPEDDPVRRDLPAAEAALRAYCAGAGAELDAELARIPFRSPYRDLRQVLKAASLLEGDPVRAEQLLARVKADSPFRELVRTFLASRVPAGELLARYAEMDPAQQDFVSALRGWTPELLALGRQLARLGERPANSELIELLGRHRELFGEDFVRHAVPRLLGVSRRAQAAYRRVFGELTPFDGAHARALHLEQEHASPSEVHGAWIDAYFRLQLGADETGTRVALVGALILRHTALFGLRTTAPEGIVWEALERSLVHDPGDLATYVELVQLYRKAGKLKEARRVMGLALAHVSPDLRLLTEAVETAVASGAFKKAARYAREALVLDPINPRVREVLIGAHLAHARKQIRQGKTALASKELDAAAEWARDGVQRGRVELLRGVLAFKEKDARAAGELLSAGCEHAGGGALGRLHLLLEGQRMGVGAARLLKQAGLPERPGPLSRADVLGLVHVLDALHNEEPARLRKVLGGFVRALQEAAGEEGYTRQDLELICETWARLGQSRLRAAYAAAGLSRWPGVPVFVYHAVDAGRRGPRGRMSWQKLDWLEDALAIARREGDARTARRIEELIDAADPFRGADFGSPFDAGPGLPDFEGILDELSGGRGQDGMRELLDALVEEGELEPEPEPERPRRRRRSRGGGGQSGPDDDPEQQELF